MKKLLIFIHSLDGGGAERVVCRLVRHWATRADIDIHIAVMKPRFAYGGIEAATVHVLGKEQSNFAGKLLEQPLLLARFRRLVTTLQPDTVLALMPRANALAVLARDCLPAGARLVLSERTSPGMQYTGLTGRLIRAAHRFLYPTADSVISVSHGIARELAQGGVPAEKITTISNPCDVAELELLANAEETNLHPWLVDGQGPVFLSVGRYAPEKGFVALLQAFEQVQRVMPARLLIMGKGMLEPQLRDEIQRLRLQGKADLVPFSANPFVSMRRAYAYVLSSKAEGFPNALLEAMALGTPCIAYDCETGPSELLAGGQCGLLVAPQGDVAALAQAMVLFLADPALARKMGDAAQDRAKGFTLGNVARLYESTLFNEDYQ